MNLPEARAIHGLHPSLILWQSAAFMSQCSLQCFKGMLIKVHSLEDRERSTSAS